jgi:serine/threonine protein kinase
MAMLPGIYLPGRCIDHYQIVRLLGQGVASRVYLAQDLFNQSEVVLKFPLDDLVGGAAIYSRYKREGEIGKILDHPAIQCHVNQGEQRQEEYLVLEYLHGRNLREVMHDYAPELMPADKVLDIMLSVCEALVYAHEHGVTHRDIKPENIFLLDDGNVKVIDFGIAMLKSMPEQSSKLQLLPILIGTPGYMSPERLLGAPGEVQADVYAVGIVLYELLSGHTPFLQQDSDGFALATEQVSHDPPSILQLNPHLSPTLATVVMRAIRRDPEKRYATMRDLLYDLGHLDDVTPVEYIPDPPKFGGRYRQIIVLGLITLAICVLIVLFGVLAQFVHHAIH